MIIDLDFLRQYVEIDSEEEAKYQTLIASSNALARSYLGYEPELQQLQETYVLKITTNKLFLFNHPVNQIYVVKVSGIDLTDNDFYYDKELGIIDFYRTYLEGAEIYIDYDAGLHRNNMPLDLKDAVAKLVLWEKARNTTQDYGMRSQIQEGIITTRENDIPMNVKTILNKYVRTSLFSNRPVEKPVLESRAV